MKESYLLNKVRKYLESLGWTTFKMHGSIYTPKSFSDLFGYLPNGQMFFLEVKTPGNKITPAQLAFLNYHKERGAVAFWIDSMEMLVDKYNEIIK